MVLRFVDSRKVSLLFLAAESENALSFAELPLVLEIFLLLCFLILLDHGAFSSMRYFFNVILLVSHSKFRVHLLHTTYKCIDLYKISHNVDGS